MLAVHPFDICKTEAPKIRLQLLSMMSIVRTQLTVLKRGFWYFKQRILRLPMRCYCVPLSHHAEAVSGEIASFCSIKFRMSSGKFQWTWD